MAKKYVNGRWVSVADTTSGGSAQNASTGVLPQRDTPTAVGSTDSGNGKLSSDTSEKDYEEESYDIIEGTVDILKADMGIQCRGAVSLKGLGKVFSHTYYVSGVKVTLNATSMKQTLSLHRDNIGEKKKSKVVSAPRLAPVPTQTATRTYTVKRGDCLWRIAQKELGKASRWPEIYNMNKGVIGSNPNLIYPGQVYTLPA